MNMKNNNKTLDYLNKLKEKYKNVTFYNEQSFLKSLKKVEQVNNKDNVSEV